MPRWAMIALMTTLVLGAPQMLRADPLDGQWQGSAPQVRASGGGYCFLGFFLDVVGDKLSGVAQTEKGEAQIAGTIRPDGSFTYTATRPNGGGSTTGSGKFADGKFQATQHTPCGDVTATGVHIG